MSSEEELIPPEFEDFRFRDTCPECNSAGNVVLRKCPYRMKCCSGMYECSKKCSSTLWHNHPMEEAAYDDDEEAEVPYSVSFFCAKCIKETGSCSCTSDS